MDLTLSEENGTPVLIEDDVANTNESPIPENESDPSEGSAESDVHIGKLFNTI